MRKLPFITKNILLLSYVSFFTDIASEMLYPVMPLFLAQSGYSFVAIGFLEGVAEAVSGLNKVFIGHISDKLNRRNLFVRLGYGISTFAKPAIAFFPTFWFVFAMRLLDRVGKGIRTAPRDAILVAESKPEDRGRVFGFHRSMDTAGAMLGPIIATIFLFLHPEQYSGLFILALVPGVVALTFTFLLGEEKQATTNQKKTKATIKSFLDFWHKSDPLYKRLLVGFFFWQPLTVLMYFSFYEPKRWG